MNLRRFLLTLMAAVGVPATALAHGVTVNVDLNADGTKIIIDRPVYADRDITAISNIDSALGYDQDDDVPGFEFSGNVLFYSACCVCAGAISGLPCLAKRSLKASATRLCSVVSLWTARILSWLRTCFGK